MTKQTYDELVEEVRDAFKGADWNSPEMKASWAEFQRAANLYIDDLGNRYKALMKAYGRELELPPEWRDQ